MITLRLIILVIYVFSLSFIAIFCMMQLRLLYYYLRYSKGVKSEEIPTIDVLPFVTIQLPIYNEQLVVNRLIDNIVTLDYPKSLIQIQVIDDSTDSTLEISRKQVEKYAVKGYDITLHHRTDRSGYKAGALKAAMPQVKGEFIAIFDADFLPDADFLRRTLPYFQDSQIGVVQTRWGHLNEDYSFLTKLQAFQLNVHFTVEQLGRYTADFLLQFNGTAGVWRKETIDSAGGWEADTLTEDLDLSYRAQMKNWKIKYLEQIETPAELPSEIQGFKSQQYRWMKGGAETAKKLLPSVWKSKLPLRQKIHSTIHLFSSSIFLAILALSIASVPLLHYINDKSVDPNSFIPFMISTTAIIAVYFTANINIVKREKSILYRTFYFLLLFPAFLSLSMAMAFHNSIAVLQGYAGKVTAFVRTPKYNIVNKEDKIRKKNQPTSIKFDTKLILELLLALLFVAAIIYSIVKGVYALLPMHLALASGYFTLFYLGIKQQLRT